MTADGLPANLALDADGHLVDRRDWSPAVARALARRDGLELGDEHWQVIEFVREYYERFELAPPMRVLVRTMAREWGPERGSSRYLYRLFADSPARQACCYAGLPKPVGCI